MSVPLNTRQFHPALESVEVPVSRLVGTQVYVHGPKVERMADKDPASMPEPIVAKVGNRFLVGDGHHRVAAGHVRKDKKLMAKVVR